MTKKKTLINTKFLITELIINIEIIMEKYSLTLYLEIDNFNFIFSVEKR